jgi:hypothetical protein
LSCAICETRKEKRFCPAIHGRICPQCCGTEREVTLESPSECPYLQQARAHEKPRSLDEVEQSSLFPQVALSEQFLYEHEHLVVGLSFGIVKAARVNRLINDRDIIAALSSLARSYETMVNSGLVYETPTANIVQQAIAGEIQKMIGEYRDLEIKQIGHVTLKDAEVLRALVFLVRMAHARTSGRPKSRSYLEFLLTQFPEKSGVVGAESGGSSIIVP